MGVIKAKKENKVYTITEQQKKRYLQEGYDIYDGEGCFLEHSPKKKIAYSEHMEIVKELVEEIEHLQNELTQLKTGGTGNAEQTPDGDVGSEGAAGEPPEESKEAAKKGKG